VTAPSLGPLFAPRAVALVGIPGDPERPGARPLHFLRRHGYAGGLYPVHPRHAEIGGLRAYRSLLAVPRPVDVAWIGLPAGQAPEAVRECGRAGIPFAVVLGAGFAETGADGEAAQARLLAAAGEAGVRLVGPNTVGFLNAWDGVALTFSTAGEVPALVPGPVALLSQSGGTGGCLLNRAVDRGLGVGLFVSTGNEADLTLADYVEWLVADGRARAVACLVEQVRAPARFAAAVRAAAARGVAVAALKLGASPAGARAARSHTGSLVGRRDAWQAWARAVGLLEVGAPEHLVETANLLARAPAPGGSGLAMVTSSGGMAVLLADGLESRGFRFVPLAAETRARLGRLAPAYAALGNPVDVTAGLPEPIFGDVLAAVTADPGVDLVVVPLTMATAAGGLARAEQVVRGTAAGAKPVAVCWPGGSLVAAGRRRLDAAGVPLFDSVASCAAGVGALRDFHRARPPAPAPPAPPPRLPPLPAGAGPLGWAAVRALLEAAGLPAAPEVVVASAAAAREVAPRLPYPVAVKVLGPLHRTEVDGVRLDVRAPEAFLAAVEALLPRGEGCLVQPMVAGVEVLVGAFRDAALGPLVLVAPGGVETDLQAERALWPAPAGPAEAAALLDGCPGLAARLAGYRGRPGGDRRALADVVVRASRLAAALGERLEAMDLNPVMAGPSAATVVDARVVLAGGPGAP
jgi:acyl-CoA synthetase (NDP forming)